MGSLFEGGGCPRPLVLYLKFANGYLFPNQYIFYYVLKDREKELDKEAQAQMNKELYGWKLVVGDVFGEPNCPKLIK